MTLDQEIELKEALNSLINRYRLGGHLLGYLDEGKIKFIGEMSMSALAPMLMKALADKLSK